MTTRRKVLAALAGLGLAVAAPAGGFLGWVYLDAGRSNTGELAFRNRLRVPPLLAPERRDGQLRFRLELQTGTTELLPGTRTATWGANGSYLGPTLRAERGDQVRVEVHNRLPEPTTLHWHGMHLPSEMDGGPHQEIAVDRVWRPHWRIDQPAATTWYHPHLHHATARHVYQGVAGLFLIDDPAAGTLPLPAEYGVDDVPVILQDKRIARDGTLDTTNLTFGGVTVTGLLGETILVNGVYDPYLPVIAERTRLRLLNAANARVFYVGFADDREFSLIGTDGGLLEAPHRLDRLLLSPGERAEIVVECRPGEHVIMRSFPPPLGTNLLFERLAGGHDTHDLLQLRAARELRPAPPLPAQLVAQPEYPAPAGDPFRLRMGDFTLNDQTMDPDRLDRVVTAETVETWEVNNGQAIPHNLHIHGASFRVRDVDGASPAAHHLGEKDTVYVEPGTRVRLAVRFLPYSDPVHPYMFHCHLLAHEDAGMMGQFVTVTAEDAARVSAHWAEPAHAGHD